MGDAEPGRAKHELSPLRSGRKGIWLLAAAVWTVFIAALATVALDKERDQVRSLARGEAIASLEKDLVYRRWAARHGGIYVPETVDTPPNPYLRDIPERDLATPSGRKLTLVNPAYMTRQVQELGNRQYGVRGHITSLNPIRPENGPTPWEREALQAFARGAKEFASFTDVDGEPRLLYMRALVVEEACLKCHGFQGYEVGDVRGGLSVSVPMAQYLSVYRRFRAGLVGGLGTIWALGLGGLFALWRTVERSYRAEERFRLSMAATSDGLWDWNASTGDVYFSPSYYRMLGYEPGEFPSSLGAWGERLHPDDREKSVALALSCVEGKVDYFEMEFRMRAKDGSWRWILGRGQALTRGPDGRAIRLIGTHVDVTDRKSEEERRAASDSRYRSLFENMTEAFALHEVVLDESGAVSDYRWLDVNPAFERETGLSRQKVVGASQKELLPDEDPFWRETYGKIALGGPPVHLTHYSEPLKKHYEVYAYSPDPLKFAVLFRDVTEKLSLESQLAQAQKLESVGKLAGGVAHDFNNMLSVIIGHAELAIDQVAPPDPLREDLEEIHRAALRSADITRQLLAFARKQTVAPKVVNLNETLESMLKMIRRLIGEDVDLAWKPQPGLWHVKIDPSQVDQILANLATNARDAISGVGHLTIETSNTTIDEGYCDEHPGFVAGEYVVLSVSDDGCGIARDQLASIFEPFYTTKTADKGTGLGLATVHGIVKQNGGFINVYSEPSKGTTFRLYLPRVADATDRSEPAPAPTGAGSETILVVEDETANLNLLDRYLSSLGYRVLKAASPAEALTLAENGDAIDLLVTDVVMPGMDGRRLAEELTSRRKGLRCLFMSGYTSNVIGHRGLLDEGVHFVQKPYNLRNLAAKVREVLDA